MGRLKLTIDPGAGRGKSRRRINGARVAAALVLLACAAAALVFVIRAVFPPEAAAPDGPAPSGPAEAAIVPAPAAPALEEERIVIPLRSSLAELLKKRDFDNVEIHRIKEAVKPVYDLGKIRAGQQLRLASMPGGAWKTLEYDIDETRFLVVHNDEDGIKAEVKLVPFEVRPAFAWGVIEDSLIGALNKAGEEDSLALDLVERCFGWDIDFNTDLRKGDSFRIYVEKKYLDGRFAGYRDILAAEFTNDGNVFQAFRFTYPDTKATDYYDENGGSRRKDFLRSPIKFVTPRITSRFSASRFHPIYKIYRPHYGVDYAAPIGTEVQATADGEVTFAGRDGGAGNTVKIRHKNSYETAYLHLRGFGKGVRKGAQLKGGDTVGFVGSSGDSTGPHGSTTTAVPSTRWGTSSSRPTRCARNSWMFTRRRSSGSVSPSKCPGFPGPYSPRSVFDRPALFSRPALVVRAGGGTAGAAPGP